MDSSEKILQMGVEPKIGGKKKPKWMVKIMENQTLLKMGWFGGKNHYFGNIQIHCQVFESLNLSFGGSFGNTWPGTTGGFLEDCPGRLNFNIVFSCQVSIWPVKTLDPMACLLVGEYSDCRGNFLNFQAAARVANQPVFWNDETNEVRRGSDRSELQRDLVCGLRYTRYNPDEAPYFGRFDPQIV